MDASYEAAIEIREAINELTKELKLHRLAMTALHTTLQDVIDPNAGEQFPGYVRVMFQDKR